MYEPSEADKKKLDNIFVYHPPLPGQGPRYELIRNLAKHYVDLLTQICPPSRELSLAITNVEQAVMWANASIARNETEPIELGELAELEISKHAMDITPSVQSLEIGKLDVCPGDVLVMRRADGVQMSEDAAKRMRETVLRAFDGAGFKPALLFVDGFELAVIRGVKGSGEEVSGG